MINGQLKTLLISCFHNTKYSWSCLDPYGPYKGSHRIMAMRSWNVPVWMLWRSSGSNFCCNHFNFSCNFYCKHFLLMSLMIFYSCVDNYCKYAENYCKSGDHCSLTTVFYVQSIWDDLYIVVDYSTWLHYFRDSRSLKTLTCCDWSFCSKTWSSNRIGPLFLFFLLKRRIFVRKVRNSFNSSCKKKFKSVFCLSV